MLITRISPFDGEKHTIDLPITNEDMRLYLKYVNIYQEDTLIRTVFPNLTPAQQEFFITGISEEEWNRAFG